MKGGRGVRGNINISHGGEFEFRQKVSVLEEDM